MRIVLALAFIVAASGAHAQSFQAASCFHRIPTLAAKLDVRPVKNTAAPSIVISGCDGKNYDLIQLLTALVDKMDRAAKK